MTFQEFQSHYRVLSEAYGQAFNERRGSLIFKYVKDLPASWFEKIVDRIVLSNDVKFDFAAAANGERRAKSSLSQTRETMEAMENFGKNISEAGLSDSLKQFNANSLWEAIEKVKGG